jgi:hypothetical protein
MLIKFNLYACIGKQLCASIETAHNIRVIEAPENVHFYEGRLCITTIFDVREIGHQLYPQRLGTHSL